MLADSAISNTPAKNISNTLTISIREWLKNPFAQSNRFPAYQAKHEDEYRKIRNAAILNKSTITVEQPMNFPIVNLKKFNKTC